MMCGIDEDCFKNVCGDKGWCCGVGSRAHGVDLTSGLHIDKNVCTIQLSIVRQNTYDNLLRDDSKTYCEMNSVRFFV